RTAPSSGRTRLRTARSSTGCSQTATRRATSSSRTSRPATSCWTVRTSRPPSACPPSPTRGRATPALVGAAAALHAAERAPAAGVAGAGPGVGSQRSPRRLTSAGRGREPRPHPPTGSTVGAVTTPRDRWRAAFERSEARDADFDTMSGLPLAPVYGPDDGEFPGEWPYTRGPYASMYRSRRRTMRMSAGFGTPPDTNRRFRELLAAGGGGLSTAFDLPTLMGRDSDDPHSLGEVGKCGVAIDTLADMADLYRDIDLSKVTTSM